MATAQSIRDGLVLISWVNTTRVKSCTTTVKLPNIDHSCKLSYIIEAGNRTAIILILNKGNNTKYKVPPTVVATKNGVIKSMTLKNGRWITTFPSAFLCGCTGLILDFVIDFIGKSMTLVKAKSKFVPDLSLDLWKTKSLADVKFQLGKKEVLAHSLIIASASPVLANMLKQDLKESKEKVVKIQNMDPKVFENLLRFIYTGDASMENVNVGDLFLAADKYGIDPLREKCTLKLAKSLKIKNAISYLVKAHIHDSFNLYDCTLNFMAKNAKAICSKKEWMDLMKKHPKLCLHAMQSMILG